MQKWGSASSQPCATQGSVRPVSPTLTAVTPARTLAGQAEEAIRRARHYPRVQLPGAPGEPHVGALGSWCKGRESIIGRPGGSGTACTHTAGTAAPCVNQPLLTGTWAPSGRAGLKLASDKRRLSLRLQILINRLQGTLPDTAENKQI